VENLEAIDFLKQLNKIVFQYYPNVLMMAEESSSWPGVTTPVDDGGLGFNYKWNMGWMNDTLGFMETDFGERPMNHHLLTFPIWYAFAENYTLPLSHDEVVHGKKSLLSKMPGNYEQKFAGLRILHGYLMTSPGKKLLFMGGEFGQFIEWRDQAELDWLLLDYDMHNKMLEYTRALNHFYLREPALWENDHSGGGYQWINPHDANQSVICYLRKGQRASDTLLVIINFQPVEREHYRIGVPQSGVYVEMFNSNLYVHGGADRMRIAPLHSEPKCWHDCSHSIELVLPPLSFMILKPVTRSGRRLKPHLPKLARYGKKPRRKYK
jgi:1,4-alpha-glucan branching enzyme